MNKAIRKFAGWIKNSIVFILAYIFLMIDRQILVPFQWITSHSATELQKKPDRYVVYAVLRVTITALIIGLIFLFKTIF